MEKFYNGRVKPNVDRQLFDRIYDRDVQMHFDVDQKDGMWIIDVRKHQHKLIAPEKREAIVERDKKSICILHDMERGPGSTGDAALAESAAQKEGKTLREILRIERNQDLKATYCVVGSLLNDVRSSIEQDGHCIAFHSYDHHISRQPVTNYMRDEAAMLPVLSKVGYKVTDSLNVVRRLLALDPVAYQPIVTVYREAMNRVRKKLSLPLVINQFAACRRVDWRIKGYRHYQPETTSDVRDEDLCYYNFEWLAIDEEASMAEPFLQTRVVKIPVCCNERERREDAVSFAAWEGKVIDRIKQGSFTAIALHERDADYWLPHYAAFLGKIASLGQLRTFDEVADHVFLTGAV